MFTITHCDSNRRVLTVATDGELLDALLSHPFEPGQHEVAVDDEPRLAFYSDGGPLGEGNPVVRVARARGVVVAGCGMVEVSD